MLSSRQVMDTKHGLPPLFNGPNLKWTSNSCLPFIHLIYHKLSFYQVKHQILFKNTINFFFPFYYFKKYIWELHLELILKMLRTRNYTSAWEIDTLLVRILKINFADTCTYASCFCFGGGGGWVFFVRLGILLYIWINRLYTQYGKPHFVIFSDFYNFSCVKWIHTILSSCWYKISKRSFKSIRDFIEISV